MAWPHASAWYCWPRSQLEHEDDVRKQCQGTGLIQGAGIADSCGHEHRTTAGEVAVVGLERDARGGVFETRLVPAEEFVIGDVVDTELSGSECGHFGVEALVIGDEVVGGDLRSVLLDGHGEQTWECGIVLKDGTEEHDLVGLRFRGGDGEGETVEISVIPARGEQESVDGMSRQVLGKNEVHERNALFVGADILLECGLTARCGGLHDVGIREDGGKSVPELRGVAVTD